MLGHIRSQHTAKQQIFTWSLFAPTVQDTMVPAPVVIPPVATMNDDEEPVLQDPIETIATHEGKQQQPQTKDVPKCGGP